ncbi:uncharacterized protein [Anabrus simplex]|uniref:uncharacterized protein n=1 Tax=Anabrus simplex TaxID=316456 RepID=UPI0035A26392
MSGDDETNQWISIGAFTLEPADRYTAGCSPRRINGLKHVCFWSLAHRQLSCNLDCDWFFQEIMNATPYVSEKHISELCDYVLLEIFSYISALELAQSVAHVCTRWNNLLRQDCYIWRNKWLVWDVSYTVDDFQKVISSIPNLCSLKLYSSIAPEHVDAVGEILSSVSKLQRLDLSLDHTNDELLQFITTHLQDFSVKHVSRQCYKKLSNFKNLTTLRLNTSYDFCGSHLRELADSCPLLAKLSVLHSRGLTEGDVLYFIKRKRDTLEVLEVNGYGISDSVFLSLGHCKKLRHLRVIDARLMSEHTLQEIISLPRLKALNLSRLRLSREQLVSVGFTACKGRINTYLENESQSIVKFEFD